MGSPSCSFPFHSVVLVFSLTIIAAGSATAQESSETPWFNAEALPISLERIKRQLDRLPVRDEGRNLYDLVTVDLLHRLLQPDPDHVEIRVGGADRRVPE